MIPIVYRATERPTVYINKQGARVQLVYHPKGALAGAVKDETLTSTNKESMLWILSESLCHQQKARFQIIDEKDEVIVVTTKDAKMYSPVRVIRKVTDNMVQGKTKSILEIFTKELKVTIPENNDEMTYQNLSKL